jgi:hypothetical protein
MGAAVVPLASEKDKLVNVPAGISATTQIDATPCA